MHPAQGHIANWTFVPKGDRQSAGTRSEKVLYGYRWGFNGMEKVDEMYGTTGNSYDFGARLYDARIARASAIDRFGSAYPSESPYSFFGNNPVSYIDCGGNFRVSAELANRYPALVQVLNALSNMVSRDLTDAAILSNPLIQQFIQTAGIKGAPTTQVTKIRSILENGQGPLLHVFTASKVRNAAGVAQGRNWESPGEIRVGLLRDLLDATNGTPLPRRSSVRSLDGDPVAALFALWETLLHEGIHTAVMAFSRVNEVEAGLELGDEFDAAVNPNKLSRMGFSKQLPVQMQLTSGDMGFDDISSHPFQLDRHSVEAYMNNAGANAPSPVVPEPSRNRRSGRARREVSIQF